MFNLQWKAIYTLAPTPLPTSYAHSSTHSEHARSNSKSNSFNQSAVQRPRMILSRWQLSRRSRISLSFRHRGVLGHDSSERQQLQWIESSWVLKQTVRCPGFQMEQTKRTSADAESNEPHVGHSKNGRNHRRKCAESELPIQLWII